MKGLILFGFVDLCITRPLTNRHGRRLGSGGESLHIEFIVSLHNVDLQHRRSVEEISSEKKEAWLELGITVFSTLKEINGASQILAPLKVISGVTAKILETIRVRTA